MNQSDAARFFELLDLTYDMIGVGAGKIISPAAKAMFFQDLERYPLDLIEGALAAHRQDPKRGSFTPKVSDITYQIERRRRVLWLPADEAWARISKPGKPVKQKNGKINYGAAEPGPCLLTNEIAQALAAATPLLEAGDDIAARMAFKGCYDRLVERAKLERRGPVYFVSPGGSFEEQQAVVDEGVRQGLLAAPAPTAPLLESSTRTIGAKPDLKALMLSLNQKTMPPPEAQDYE